MPERARERLEFVASVSTLSLLATTAELNSIGTIDEMKWAGIDALVWNAVIVNLGRVGKLRFFSALWLPSLPRGSSQRDVRSQATQVGSAWRVARQPTNFQSTTDFEYTHHCAE